MALATKTTRTPAVTRCPVCGGLECLCRPRFFAGQLLTEDDLNRLERYVIDKNRLHNRYLHGWGVVCGLEVVCHACKGFVTVKSGYALSPCGDDIVVCRDTVVNVCELIQHCRRQPFECEPAFPSPDPICGDQDEPWILYLCYDERTSRGVTPLYGGSGSTGGSQCGCGGSSSCGCGSSASGGCGCQGTAKSTGHSSVRRTQPKTPPQCEPTITCEGYTFQLRKVPPPATRRDLGDLVNRLRDCLNELARLQIQINKLNQSSQPATQILAIKNALINLMNQHSIYKCDLFQRIAQVEPVPPVVIGAPSAASTVHAALSAITRELFIECVCSALLPPCPAPAEDNCVPIATLTLNCAGGCHVVRICNWENRRLSVNFPTLEYWFTAFLRLLGVSDAFNRICCGPERGPQVDDVAPVNVLDSIFNQAVGSGGNVDSQVVSQQLGALLMEMLAFTRR